MEIIDNENAEWHLCSVIVVLVCVGLCSRNGLLRRQAKAGNPGAVRVMLMLGANVNARDRDGNTPLYFATFHRYPETMKLLLDHGADVNAKNKEGRTALDMAIQEHRDEVAELLRQHGATE